MPCSLTNTASLRSSGPRTIGAAILAIAVPLLCAHAAYAQATPPGPMKWNYAYYPGGNLKTITDPNGGLTDYTYDTLNRLRTIMLPAPGPGLPRPRMLLDYDGGTYHVSRVQDPRGVVTLYDIDGLGRMLSVQSPDSGLTTFTYDGGNEPLTRTDARGITHTYTYDDGNRLERIDYPTGTPTVYEYGQVGGIQRHIGRLAKITDESGSTSYDYVGLGHVKSKTQVVNSAAGSRTFTVTTDWGESGIATNKPTRIVYPSGTSVEIGYEYAGRPGSITVTRNGQASILLSGVTYNALHALQGWNWGDGTPYQRTFDNFARLSTYPLGNPAGAGAAMGLTRTLSYDNTANIIGYLHTGQAGFDQVHRYDGLDRLIETLKTSTRYGYQYDATGNRRVREIGSDSYLHMVEDGSNRLTTVQEPSESGGVRACTYHYGPVGNLTSDGTNFFVYGDRGRMSRADTPNGSVSYLINGLEQRVSKTGLMVPTGAAYYVYDDQEGKLLGEYDANGTPLYEVIYLRGMPVGVVTPTGLYYVYADHAYTPRVIARNTDHAIVWRWDEAEAFGATPPNEDPNGFGAFTFNMRFPGQVYDRETGLFYNWYRDYEPARGNYVQSDPLGPVAGINTFAYTYSNPLSYVDPNGLQIPMPLPPVPIPGIPNPTADANKSIAEQLTRALQGNGDDKPKRTYQTYTRYNPMTGRCYSGRTSGYDDPETNVRNRGFGQPILNAEGFLPPKLDRSTDSYSTARGREQMLIDINGGAQSVGGVSRNMINGISPYNPLRPLYYIDALQEFGVPVPAGDCTCQ